MNTIINEIKNSLKELSLHVIEIDGKEILSKIIHNFCKNEKYDYPLWDNYKDTESIYNIEGWKLITDFHPSQEKILFIEPDKQNVFFQFQNSLDVVSAIGNCSGFTFYITDKEANYVICFNDHDYLIGTGLAKKWVISMQSKTW